MMKILRIFSLTSVVVYTVLLLFSCGRMSENGSGGRDNLKETRSIPTSIINKLKEESVPVLYQIKATSVQEENLVSYGFSSTKSGKIIYTGSCFGSTSPVSINKKTDEPYRLTFPELAVEDMANASALLLKKLGIDSIKVLVGPSLGGMKALAFSILHNTYVKNLILISSATQALPYAIAMRSLQREVIRKDPLWNNGFYSYENPPLNGVRIARKIGMVSYRSSLEWTQRFGRKRSEDNKLNQNTFGIENTSFEFEIESYLEHQAVKFQNIFDANCYLYLSRAMDWFDIAKHGESTLDAISKTNIEKALILGVSTDILFPPQQQKEIAELLSISNTIVEYKELDCLQGHDSFLVDTSTFSEEIIKFVKNL